MMSITILGCTASVPTPARGMPSVAVQIDGDVILLDCGEGTQRQMMQMGVSYSAVQAVFISHLHLDHFLGLFGLLETMRLNGRTAPVRLYGPSGSARVFAGRPLLEVHEIGSAHSPADGKTPMFSIREHDLCVFPVSHGLRGAAFGVLIRQRPYRRFHEAKAKMLGLKGPMFTQIQKEGKLKIGKKTVSLEDVTYVQEGKSLCYSGDTEYCETLVKAAQGVDLLIHEATFDESQRDAAREKFHSTAGDAAKAAAKAKVKRLLLTHISGRYADPAPLVGEAKKIFPNAEAAKDGWKTTL